MTIDVIVKRWLVQMKRVIVCTFIAVPSVVVLIFSSYTFALKWEMGGVGLAYGLLCWVSTSLLLSLAYIFIWMPRTSDIKPFDSMTADVFKEWGPFLRQGVPMMIIYGLVILIF